MIQEKIVADSVVGLCAPYSHDEATQLACSVGELLRHMRLKVSYFPIQEKADEVCIRWDRDIHSLQYDPNKWAKACDTFIWLQPQYVRLSKIRQKYPRRKHLLIFQGHRVTETEAQQLIEFDQVVCCSSEQYNSLHRRQHRLQEKLVCCPWDSMLPLGQGRSLHRDCFRLLVAFQNATGPEQAGTLSVLHLLCEQFPTFSATLTHTKRFSKEAFTALITLQKQFPDRISVMEKPDSLQRLDLYNRHHWMLAAQTHSDAGTLISEALCRRLPVVAWDAAPFNELIQHQLNGFLMPCEVERNWLQLSTAKPNRNTLLESLRTVVTDSTLYNRVRSAECVAEERRRREFTAKWKQVVFA